ncbi:MAG: ribonucleotide reductase N-terminal alpha domain-containing protein, partial [Pseudomonadota bacterium]
MSQQFYQAFIKEITLYVVVRGNNYTRDSVMVENTLAAQIWNDKYKFNPQIGEGDENIAATWRRVANAIAQNEPEQIRSQWAQTYFDALQDFRFIPAGRILAGAGTSRAV